MHLLTIYLILLYFRFLFVTEEWLLPGQLEEGFIITEFRLDHVSQARLLPENPSLVEKHFLSSVVKKPVHSIYTSAQRLSVCFSVFFLMTTANAMFYQTGNKNTNFSITLAFITIKWTQFYSSLMSVLIVYPPIMIMAELFRRSKHDVVSRCKEACSTRTKKSLPLSITFCHFIIILIEL